MNNEVDKNYKSYRNLAIFFSLTSLTILTLKAFGRSHDFFDGIALTFIVLVLLMAFKFFVKRNDPDFKDELYMKDNDERLQLMRYKRNSKISRFSFSVLVVLLTISMFYDFSFKVGASILVWSQLIIGLILLLIDKRKQKG